VFVQHRKRADDATRRNKQLEKEMDDARHRLSQVSAELESAVQANRNYQSELVKVKSLNEQFAEQIDIITRDKRRLQGQLFMSIACVAVLSSVNDRCRFVHCADELDVTLNQLSDLNTRIVDMDRVRKQLEAEKLSLNSSIDEYREQLHIEINKYNSLNASVEKFRLDFEKKLAEKDEELDTIR
jgi:predicted  nucleic acid-binding Zn-ribbon protein